MPQSTDSTTTLLTLKTQLERSLTAAQTNASHLREQLSHVNALLMNQLLSTTASQPAQVEAVVPNVEVIAPAKPLSLAPASPKTKASDSQTKVEPQPAQSRTSRELLPAYRGLTRLEAISRVLQATPGQEVTADSVSQALFGELSAAEHKAERKSLNTQLYKGAVQKLWKKGKTPATFLIDATKAPKTDQPTPTATAKAPSKAKPTTATAKSRKSLDVLPVYQGMSKREAIAQILAHHSGEVLHHDTIIQMLYGDLSLKDLKDERVRIKTALLTGVKDSKWQKATAPSSYFIWF